MVWSRRHSYDVVVIGAGGSGSGAVIEARQRGLKVAVVISRCSAGTPP